jgi:hypothetical protein
MKEIWKSIPKYFYYEISSLGRLRSKDKPCTYVYRKTGTVVNRVVKGRLLNPSLNKDGYYHTVLIRDDGVAKVKKIHRLVARAFLGRSPRRKMVVMHKDDDRTNNHWKNLQWGTTQENTKDRDLKLRQARGQGHGNALFTDAEVRKIAKLLRKGWFTRDIADLFQVKQRTILAISSGQSWSHITGFVSSCTYKHKRKSK